MSGCVRSASAAVAVAADDGARCTKPPYDPGLSTETGTVAGGATCIHGAPAG
jgi:hypothetical protein